MALAVFAIGLGYLTTTSAYYSIPISTVGYDWLALFYLTAMILALVDSNSWLGRTMRWQWLRSLGAVAYGLYLIHVAVQLLCMFYLRGHGILLRNPADLGVTLLALGLTIALAQLSWRFFEKPIVRWGHKMEYEPRPISGTPSTPEQREAAS
jgi:peptidoglycan/LPS O-acetylase OafA/YrhL